MDLEHIVQQILMARRDLSREEVLKKIIERKHSAGDYFLDEVAARLVANDLGVEIPNAEDAFHTEIAVKDLVSGLNDVTIVGRVIVAYPIQTFPRSDLTEGKVARLLLADKTGSLRLVLWDEKVHMVESGRLRPEQIVKILHGYVRDAIDGRLELHLGKKGDIETSLPNAVESNYPQINDFMDKIRQLTSNKRRASVQGLICEVFPPTEFQRPNGNPGKVRRLRIKDDTGETTLVVWNQRVDELGEIQIGDYLRIMDARVKSQPDGRMELHAENSTQIEKLADQTLPQPPSTIGIVSKVIDLKEESGPVNIEATVASTPEVREVTTAQNEQVLVASFDLTDDTGIIRISLWRKHAELARELSVGTRIRVKNIYVKKGFSSLLELTSRTSTIIEIIPKPEVADA